VSSRRAPACSAEGGRKNHVAGTAVTRWPLHYARLVTRHARVEVWRGTENCCCCSTRRALLLRYCRPMPCGGADGRAGESVANNDGSRRAFFFFLWGYLHAKGRRLLRSRMSARLFKAHSSARVVSCYLTMVSRCSPCGEALSMPAGRGRVPPPHR
jgi:hypothetical protein